MKIATYLLSVTIAFVTAAVHANGASRTVKLDALGITNLQAIFPGLPLTLRRNFADCEVKIYEDSHLRVNYLGPDVRSAADVAFGGLSSGLFSQNQCGTFIFSTPFQNGTPVIDLAFSGAFLEFLERNFYSSMSKTDIEAHFRLRILKYGAAKLLNLPLVDDSVASIWWKLRMEGAETKSRTFRKGEAVLLAFRTYGYKGSSYTPGDFGHSSLGVRFLDGDVSRDFVLNPGAKTPDGYDGNLFGSIFGDKRVPNRVEVYNLWDWLQTQTQTRHLKVDVRMLKISTAQAEGLFAMKREFSQLNWGPFKMLVDNCAHGALDIYDTLLPVDRALPVSLFLGIGIPASVVKEVSQRFYRGAKIYLPEKPLPPNARETPDGNIVVLANRRATPGYVIFKQAESKLLRH